MIRRMHQIHTSLFLEEMAEFNITPVQYSLMSALSERGEIDQNTLAIEIGLERTGVAEVLPRLEARGLLERRQSTQDRRVKLVKLSKEGRALYKRMANPAQRAHDRTIEQLEPADRERFMLHLVRLVEANQGDSIAPLRIK